MSEQRRKYLEDKIMADRDLTEEDRMALGLSLMGKTVSNAFSSAFKAAISDDDSSS